MPRDDGFEGLVGHRCGADFEVDPTLEPRLARITARPTGNQFHESIFTRDVGSLLPYDRGAEPGFVAELETVDSNATELIIDSLPTYYPARTLHEGVREFSNECAERLIYGPVALEIEHFSDRDGRAAREFAIHYLPFGTVSYRRHRPIQLVPRSLSEKRHKGNHYLELDPSTLVIVDLKPDVRTLMDQAIRIFRLADRQQFLAVDVLTDRQNSHRGFDAEEHRRRLQVILLRETRSLGWAESLDGVALDPYKVWRHLQFVKLQVGIRESILSGLQEVISKAGARGDFDARLRVTGLVDLDDVIAAQNSLLAGTAPIKSLLRL